MTAPDEPPDPNEPLSEPNDPPSETNDPGQWPDARPASELEPPPDPLLFRVLRSTIAPDVLGDAGHDAPLSPRGRVLFWGTIAVLVVAIAVLFLVTVSK